MLGQNRKNDRHENMIRAAERLYFRRTMGPSYSPKFVWAMQIENLVDQFGGNQEDIEILKELAVNQYGLSIYY